jgi:Sec-independent protein secretion pathway component TatC
MVMLAVPLIIMYELSIVIARYVNPTTEVTAHNLDRADEDEEEDFEPEAREEDGNERDL